MKGAEIVRREAASLKKRHGQRVTHYELQQGGGGRRQVVRACLAHLRQAKNNRRLARQRRLLASRKGDQRNRETARIGDDALQLRSFARPGQRQDHIARRDHAEVAVVCFNGMNEEGRRSGRRERGCDLGADVATLADARNDHASGDPGDEIDGLSKGLGKAVAQSMFKRGKRFFFGFKGSDGRCDGRSSVCLLGRIGQHLHAISAFTAPCHAFHAGGARVFLSILH